MALERAPVLPKGFYWIDVLGPANIQRFAEWRAKNAATVKVRSSTDFPGDVPPRQWLLWEVLEPTLWLPARVFGFPNKAASTTTIADAASGAAPQKDVLDQVADKVNVGSIGSGLLTAAAVAALGLLGVVLLGRKT